MDIHKIVWSAVLEDKAAGALMVQTKKDSWPVQIQMTGDELESLHRMLGETLAEVRKREKAQQGAKAHH
ncbi:uncharacterized protein YdeI (YjbR/CyaY-like superfamily) [Microvirga flocculans]|uniref:Uncharacterized protein YdeI (YjbR/CyaY-like superfamily) n=1 Tax=Microvirga flocculans TaxID=217168 RepID=A0A7W6IIM9_9HYPH|nr:hypothetical protein [Microvirga flocculans]MBB4042039.1 uncharacterized protein YdeI (YjbR/CyaY-like superfamily) [Microvirga flocculans]